MLIVEVLEEVVQLLLTVWPSDKQHLQQELQHIKSTLTTINGYPSGEHQGTATKTSANHTSPHKSHHPLHGQDITQTPTNPEDGQHRSQTLFPQQTSLHTHKDRKHKNTQPGVYIGETGRSFNTIIKEHKACQRLGDGGKSAIVKHAQQQHKINWEDSSLITSIPHWHTRRVREAIEILQHNTVPQDSGLRIKRHLASSPAENGATIQHNQELNIKSLHSRLQPIHKSSTLQ